jgi:hypothetical protein
MKRTKTRNWLAMAALLPVLAGGLTAGCDDDEDSPADGGTGGRGGTGGGTGGTGGSTGGTGGGTGGTGGGGVDAGDMASGDGASACSTTPTPVMADITTDTTWPCGVYVLKQKVYVTMNAKLTIAAGSTIQGDVAALDPSALIIARGSQLIAKGTRDKPIVFTSGNSVGSRKGGEWAGVALLGNARINTGAPCAAPGAPAGCLESGIEGIPATEVKAKFGGTDDASSCGELEYVRIEFAGQQLEPNRELNGLTLGGCGSGTKVSYVQVHRGTDDGIEVFGGTANMDHIVLTGNEDDSLDWDFGWTGRVQFLVIHQRQNSGDNGIEASNSPQMYAAMPRAKPVLWNVTMIGRGDGVSGDMARPSAAFHLKDGTQGVMKNFIVQGFKLDVVDVNTTRDPAVDPNTEWPANLSIENSIFWANPMWTAEAAGTPADDDKGFDDKAKTEEAARNNKFDVDPMLTTVPDLLTNMRPNWVPKNAAVTGAAPAAPFDTTATYAGAFAPNATTLWTDGWTDFPAN